jgi:hypothetical protein
VKTRRRDETDWVIRDQLARDYAHREGDREVERRPTRVRSHALGCRRQAARTLREARRAVLAPDPEADLEDGDEYLRVGVFWVPKEARRQTLYLDQYVPGKQHPQCSGRRKLNLARSRSAEPNKGDPHSSQIRVSRRRSARLMTRVVHGSSRDLTGQVGSRWAHPEAKSQLRGVDRILLLPRTKSPTNQPTHSLTADDSH